jgi:HK97 family phage portal protein
MGIANYLWRALGLTDQRLVAYFGGQETDAGEHVGIDSALQVATVWACVRLIAETVATLPLFLYRKSNGDSRVVAKEHPLYRILHDAPHADYTAVEFWEGVVAGLALRGNSVAEKLYAGGRLVGLEPLPWDLITVDRTDSGRRIYRYSDPNGYRVLDEDEVFHVRGFGNGGDEGLSPITIARHSIGIARAADRAASKLLKNGMRPSLILKMDQVLKEQDRQQIRENVIKPMSGVLNAGGVFLAEAGMTPHNVTISPLDAQMLETRKFHVEEICRWFRVPPFMVGHTEKSTSWGTGIEQQMIGFLTFALRPYLSRIEQAIKRSLLAPVERSSLYAEFAVEGLLRADSKSRSEVYAQALGSGGHPPWMTVDEVRGLENWPAMGGDAATLQKPANTPSQIEPPPKRLPPPEGEG